MRKGPGQRKKYLNFGRDLDYILEQTQMAPRGGGLHSANAF